MSIVKNEYSEFLKNLLSLDKYYVLFQTIINNYTSQYSGLVLSHNMYYFEYFSNSKQLKILSSGYKVACTRSIVTMFRNFKASIFNFFTFKYSFLSYHIAMYYNMR